MQVKNFQIEFVWQNASYLTHVKTIPPCLRQSNPVKANENPVAPAKPKTVVYACSGCSDAGELADRIARRLTFPVAVSDTRGLVAAGKLTRVIVSTDRFMEKAH